MSEPMYTMRISLSILDHLGANLYSDVPPVLAEVVANSWDADASEVDIDIDVERGKITITDNGHGMTLNDMNNKYLTVGYRRRNDDEKQNMTQTPEYGRRVMGRKGIGKLSLFSIADTVEVQSVKGAEKNGFVMSAEKIKEQSSGEEETPYHPEPVPDDKITLDKDGTQITLTKLKRRVTKATTSALKKRLARRFSIIGEEHNFTVRINEELVRITDRDYFHKLQYLWHYGKDSEKYVKMCNLEKPEHGKKRKEKVEVESGISYPVAGWIGTVVGSGDLKDGDDNLNKIVIMVRGKLAQEDILEDFTEGGLYTKYIIGEIHADFLDIDKLEDIATSNRQEIIKDDPRYVALQSWVKKELRHIKSKWTDLRNEEGAKEARRIPVIDKWMNTLGEDTREKANQMFGKIAQLPMETEDQRKELYQYSALAFENLAHKDRLSKLETLSPENLGALARIFASQLELEAAYYYKTVEQRLSTIKGLERMVEENTLEKMIQDYLADNLWLLDPAWEGASEEIYVEQRVATAFEGIKLTNEERLGRIDIRYKKVYGHHVIIELKRPEVKTNDFVLMGQVEKYRTALLKALKQEGDTSESVEIICIVGEELQEWTTPNERLRSVRSLRERDIRVILYRELIKEARMIYQEFIEKKQKAGSLCELIKNIEIESLR